jgi:hypothetical protein
MIMAKITATLIAEYLCLPASLVKGFHQAHRMSFHISPSKYSPNSLGKLSKAILGLFVATLIYFTPPTTQAQKPSYANGTVLVKFKANSPIFAAWERNGRRGAISSLQTVLGTHTSEALFDDGLINGVIERFSRLTEDDPTKRASTLTRWCKIRLSAKIDAVFLASKLKNLPDVEYAEPLYHRALTGTLYAHKRTHRSVSL